MSYVMTRLPMRVRKLVGTILLLLLLILWTFLSITLALLVGRLEIPILSAAFYLVAGIGWALPAMPLISWMSRPDATQP